MNLTSSRRADEFSRLLETDGRTDDPVTGPMLALAEALRTVSVTLSASSPRRRASPWSPRSSATMTRELSRPAQARPWTSRRAISTS